MISIAMTTYNGEKFLKEQIDSILAQTYTDFELVIVDDCSTDSTWEILCTYKQNQKVRIFKNEKNLGFKSNFEKAISLCTGDFIALSDQDDVWLENHLQVLLDTIDQKDLACANAILVDKNLKDLGSRMSDVTKIKKIPSGSKALLTYFLSNHYFVQGSTCLLTKGFVQKALPIPTEIDYHDTWFSLFCAANNGLNYTKEPILLYRQHKNNVSDISNYKKNSILGIFKTIFENIKQSKNEKILSIQKCDVLLSKNISNESRQWVLELKKYFESWLNKKDFFYITFFVKNYKLFLNCDTNRFLVLRTIYRIFF